MKAVFVFDHFGPYHIARVHSVAAIPGWDVCGIELHAKSKTYGWNSIDSSESRFRKINLPNFPLHGRHERKALLKPLEEALESCKADVIFVNGWGDFMSLETIRWAKKKGVRLVVMSETRLRDGSRSPVGERVKRRIVSMCDAGLCGGKSHRRYLEELGLPKERVALGYNAVDNHFFSKTRNEKTVSVGECTRVHIPPPYFLASNRFVERKNLRRLLMAYAKYVESLQESGEIWPLVLLGDGDMRGELEALCRKLAIIACSFQGSVCSGQDVRALDRNYYPPKDAAASGFVVFAGFRQIEELPFFYGGAGAFVHPALSEPWGLVINEAMASGLPILSSKNVGAAEELVHNGTNGFTFDPENIQELARVLVRMAVMRQEDRKSMGEASRRMIADWGPERFAQGAEYAARAAMSAPHKRFSIINRILLEILIRK